MCLHVSHVDQKGKKIKLITTIQVGYPAFHQKGDVPSEQGPYWFLFLSSLMVLIIEISQSTSTIRCLYKLSLHYSLFSSINQSINYPLFNTSKKKKKKNYPLSNVLLQIFSLRYKSLQNLKLILQTEKKKKRTFNNQNLNIRP